MFAHPEWLWLFAASPVLIVVLIVSERRRRSDWSSLGRWGRPPSVGLVWYGLVWALLVLGLAQPRWGRFDEDQPSLGRDVVLAIDVSRSMSARDMVPDRLGRAKSLASDLILRLGRDPATRIGLVAFAGSARVRCPLTTNLGAALEILERLQAGEIEPGGTNLDTAIERADRLFGVEDDPDADNPDDDVAGRRTILVLSDGEAHAGRVADPERRAQLNRRGVIIHAIGIGDLDAGRPIPLPTEDPPTLRYQGEEVLTRRVDRWLRTWAEATDGTYIPLGLATTDLGALFVDRIEPEAERRRASRRPTRQIERFGVPLLLALFCLILGTLRFRIVAPSLTILFVIVLPGSSLPPTPDEPGDRSSFDPRASTIKARSAFEAGDFEAARRRFATILEGHPDHPTARYNLAATLFQLGRFEETDALYREALDQTDPNDFALRIRIAYALGNTLAALGRDPDALDWYDRCLLWAEERPDLEPIRRDARINRDFVLQRMNAQPLPPDDKSGSDLPSNDPNFADPSDEPGDESTNEDQTPGAGDLEPTDSTPPSNPNRDDPTDPDLNSDLSPDQQLDRALEAIDQARRTRDAARPPADLPPDDDRKAW